MQQLTEPLFYKLDTMNNNKTLGTKLSVKQGCLCHPLVFDVILIRIRDYSL